MGITKFGVEIPKNGEIADIVEDSGLNQMGINEPNGKKKRKRNKKNKTNGDEDKKDEKIEEITHVHSNKKIKFEEKENVNEVVPAVEVKEVIKQEIKEIQRDTRANAKSGATKPLEINKKKSLKVQPKVVKFNSDDESDSDSNIAKQVNHQGLKQRAETLLSVRKTLPVYKVKDKILQYVDDNQVNVLIGETGSGKSTQVPQFLIPSNRKCIAVTQPRRVAASSLATRVSEEYGCRIGQEVGYSVRFQNVATSRTKLKYLTDGMLLRELMIDPKLSSYSTVIIDEAHERTVLTDLIMGFLKELLPKRKDLKIIVMSATLDAERFSRFFGNAPILFIEGKMYPVEKFYLGERSEDIVDSMIRAVVQLNLRELEGDMLCFLPGQEEIDKAVSILNRLSPELPKEAPLLVAYPLYAALSPQQQNKIFEKLKARRRKVILATNIAETSVTVPGVKYVIDSGLRKVKVWRHQLGISTLLTAPISQASATQRSGRAGREFPGKTFRLYSEGDFNKLPKQTESEISRTDIIYPILTLKNMGVDDVLNWAWLEHPGEESVMSALTELYSLKALDDNGKITTLGKQISVIPLPPALATVLLKAFEYNCLNDCIDIAACLSVDNLILNPNNSNRDEVNFKRRAYCNLGTQFGDLISLKEFLAHYLDFKDSNERKSWCKELDFSYRGFKNVLKIRDQLRTYMRATFKATDEEKHKKIQLLLDDVEEEDNEEDGIMKHALDTSSILKAFLHGYVTNTAIGMPDRSYRTVTKGQLIAIHPSSVLFGKKLDAVMFIENVYTTRGYARTCSSIELGWLQEVAPHVLGTKISIN